MTTMRTGMYGRGRVASNKAQLTLIALDVASLGFEETKRSDRGLEDLMTLTGLWTRSTKARWSNPAQEVGCFEDSKSLYRGSCLFISRESCLGGRRRGCSYIYQGQLG